MAVDFADLVDPLKREVNPPGTDYFPNATDAEYIGNLVDGFWEAVLDGIITGYTVTEDGIVTPVSGTADFPRMMQQLVVFYAGFKILRNALRNLKTVFSAKAGPVEYEVQQASGTLRDILKDLADRRRILLTRLSDIGVSQTYYIDAVLARDDAILWGQGDSVGYVGDTRWGGSSGYNGARF